MTKPGIKGHWRPVYDTRAYATTTSTSWVTVLNLTNSRGKAWFWTKILTWNNVTPYIKITIDGVVVMNTQSGFGGGAWYTFGSLDWEKSIKIEHKRDVGGTLGTCVSYYSFLS